MRGAAAAAQQTTVHPLFTAPTCSVSGPGSRWRGGTWRRLPLVTHPWICHTLRAPAKGTLQVSSSHITTPNLQHPRASAAGGGRGCSSSWRKPRERDAADLGRNTSSPCPRSPAMQRGRGRAMRMQEAHPPIAAALAHEKTSLAVLAALPRSTSGACRRGQRSEA